MISGRMFKGKAIMLLGPRQCGKSTMAEELLKAQPQKWLYLNGDEADVREMFTGSTTAKLRTIVEKNLIVFIDEAQRIPGIGITLKLFTDQLKHIQVVATGSSAFELTDKIYEPLTGRKYEFQLYPFSFAEMAQHHGLLEEKRMLEQRLIFGYYPEIVMKPGEEKELLKLLANSYLYKDLLMLEKVKKPVLLEKLLKALALQVGSEVSYHELGQVISADKETVEKYIDLLEKAFIVFKVSSFHKAVPNEVKKSKKVYFYDCGIRNAFLNNFNPLAFRTDTGALWENFVIAERFKYLKNNNIDADMYFWRTTQQQEIDLIEDHGGKLKAFECKWNEKAKVHFPVTFTENYPGTETFAVSPGTIDQFLL